MYYCNYFSQLFYTKRTLTAKNLLNMRISDLLFTSSPFLQEICPSVREKDSHSFCYFYLFIYFSYSRFCQFRCSHVLTVGIQPVIESCSNLLSCRLINVCLFSVIALKPRFTCSSCYLVGPYIIYAAVRRAFIVLF